MRVRILCAAGLWLGYFSFIGCLWTWAFTRLSFFRSGAASNGFLFFRAWIKLLSSRSVCFFILNMPALWSFARNSRDFWNCSRDFLKLFVFILRNCNVRVLMKAMMYKLPILWGRELILPSDAKNQWILLSLCFVKIHWHDDYYVLNFIADCKIYRLQLSDQYIYSILVIVSHFRPSWCLDICFCNRFSLYSFGFLFFFRVTVLTKLWSVGGFRLFIQMLLQRFGSGSMWIFNMPTTRHFRLLLY